MLLENHFQTLQREENRYFLKMGEASGERSALIGNVWIRMMCKQSTPLTEKLPGAWALVLQVLSSISQLAPKVTF